MYVLDYVCLVALAMHPQSNQDFFRAIIGLKPKNRSGHDQVIEPENCV